MKKQGIGDLAKNEQKKSSVTWVVRDRRGKRVLGTAASLHAAIKHAIKQGEYYPLLEKMPRAEDESPGPVLWRRTL